MIKMFLWLILLSLATSCGRGFVKKKTSHTSNQQEAQEVDTFHLNQEYLSLVNNHRILLGLTPLIYHSYIEEVAKAHSFSMAIHSKPFGHLGFASRCRRLRNRLGDINNCGEIVAMKQKNIRLLLKAWLKSPEHRQEIEHPFYTHTALGIAKDDKGSIYWTQMFVEIQ
jgi:uncharacterized protein YkwD